MMNITRRCWEAEDDPSTVIPKNRQREMFIIELNRMEKSFHDRLNWRKVLFSSQMS